MRNGQTAIVTGGASGIGAALAEELARRGVEVVVADRSARMRVEQSGGDDVAIKGRSAPA